MLYLGMPTRDTLISYCDIYGGSIKADLLVYRFYDYEFFKNTQKVITFASSRGGHDVPKVVFDINNKNDNYIFIRSDRYSYGQSLSDFGSYFTQESKRPEGALAIREHVFASFIDTETACFRVNYQGQKTCDTWIVNREGSFW